MLVANYKVLVSLKVSKNYSKQIGKLEEFKNLIEAGLKMGSKYFFLVGCAHGLYFMVRDTDSEGLDSNPKRFPNEVYEVFAEGFERELGVEELNEKVAELYKGDICQ